jgi:hypothetical protein
MTSTDLFGMVCSGVKIEDLLLQHCLPAQNEIWERSCDSLRHVVMLPTDEAAAAAVSVHALVCRRAAGACVWTRTTRTTMITVTMTVPTRTSSCSSNANFDAEVARSPLT